MLFVSYTVEPRYYEGHGEWQLYGDRDLFVKTRYFSYSEVIFIHLTITGVKVIVRFTEDLVI